MFKKITTVLGIIVIALLLICCDQQGFTITGHVTGYKDGTKVKLISFEDESFEKYTTIKNNTFAFEGKAIDEPGRFIITFDNGNFQKTDGCILFIGNENVVITADRNDFPYNAVITGSKHQDILNKVNKQLAVIEPEYTKIYDEYRLLNRISDNKDSVQNAYRGENGKLTVFDRKNDSIVKNFIRENYNSYPALEKLVFSRDQFDKKELGDMYGKLLPEYKSSRFGKAIKAFLAQPQLREGDNAADFEATDDNGKTHRLYDYLNKGKHVLLEITKPICGGSIHAIPILKKMAAEKPEKLQIVSLTIRDKENWEKVNGKENFPYTRLYKNEGSYGNLIMQYDLYSTPTFFLLTPSGKIIKKFAGMGEETKEEIYLLLK